MGREGAPETRLRGVKPLLRNRGRLFPVLGPAGGGFGDADAFEADGGRDRVERVGGRGGEVCAEGAEDDLREDFARGVDVVEGDDAFAVGRAKGGEVGIGRVDREAVVVAGVIGAALVGRRLPRHRTSGGPLRARRTPARTLLAKLLELLAKGT